MRPVPFLPQNGALQSHFLFVNLLARVLHQELTGKTIFYVVSPSLSRIQLSFGDTDKNEMIQEGIQAASHPGVVQKQFYRAQQPRDARSMLELNWSADLPLLFWYPDGAPMPDTYEKQLFPAWGLQVTGVWGWIRDRRIEIGLSNGGAIWIKWFGRNGNVLYHDGEGVHSVFRRSHQGDFQFMPPSDGRIDSRDKHLPADYEAELQSTEFKGMENQFFSAQQDFHFWWKHAGFFVDKSTGVPILRPATRPEEAFLPLLEGASQFARQYTSNYSFQQKSKSTLERFKKSCQFTEEKLSRLQAELSVLQEAGDYRKQANSLLTYPDLIHPDASVVRLPDCENPNRILNIRIDPVRSPVENADRLFAKAKRQHLQQAHVQLQINQKSAEQKDLKQAIHILSAVRDPKEWRQAGAALQSLNLPANLLLTFKPKSTTEASNTARKGWVVYDLERWEVWVGRDAKGNGELLRKSHKDDIWMHARGHAGSHVLIRSAGRLVPMEVMLQAARLAAHNSKGRGEEVCAVSYTQRKYVRTVKGGPPGKVVLDREEVIFSHRDDPAPS